MNLLELGGEIASYLNVRGSGSWHVFTEHHWVRIMWGTNYGYCLRNSTDPDRYVIQGHLPDRNLRGGYVNALNYYQNELPAVITVSTAKSPARIAREIESRLEPRYILQHRKTMSVVNRVNKHIKGQDSIIEKLEPFGVEVRTNGVINTEIIGSFEHGTIWIYEDSVRFRDLTATPEQAVQILELLNRQTVK